MRLQFERGTGAQSCAEADVLRARIAERVGRDPFAELSTPQPILRIQIARTPGGWSATLSLLSDKGKPLGSRDLGDSSSSCDRLVTTIVFTVAVLLEDLPLSRTEPSSPAPSPLPSSQQSIADFETELGADRPPVRAPGNARSSSAENVRPDVAVGLEGSIGQAPAPAAGVEAIAGIDVRRFRFELGGRAEFPASGEGAASVRTRRIDGRIAPCYGAILIMGCIVVTAGSVSGEAIGTDVARARIENQWTFAGGIGALSRVPVGDAVFLRGAVDLLIPFSRIGFDVGDRRVWTVPSIAAAVSLGAGIRF